jgi:hypothetical protein
MVQLQSIANEIRDHLLDNEAVRRLRIEVLWAAGSADTLTVRARHRDRVLTVERDDRWHLRSPEEQAAELAHELVGRALDNLRATPAPARWRRSPEDPAAPHEDADAGSPARGWAAARR